MSYHDASIVSDIVTSSDLNQALVEGVDGTLLLSPDLLPGLVCIPVAPLTEQVQRGEQAPTTSEN